MHKVTEELMTILRSRGQEVRFLQQHQVVTVQDIFGEREVCREVPFTGDSAPTEAGALTLLANKLWPLRAPDDVTFVRIVSIFRNASGFYATVKSTTAPRMDIIESGNCK